MAIIWLMMVNNNLVGGIPTPLKKYESQLGLLFAIYEKIKNVLNHQPVTNLMTWNKDKNILG